MKNATEEQIQDMTGAPVMKKKIAVRKAGMVRLTAACPSAYSAFNF